MAGIRVRGDIRPVRNILVQGSGPVRFSPGIQTDIPDRLHLGVEMMYRIFLIVSASAICFTKKPALPMNDRTTSLFRGFRRQGRPSVSIRMECSYEM